MLRNYWRRIVGFVSMGFAVIGLVGDVDLIVSRFRDPGWILEFVTLIGHPPVTGTLVLGGLALVVWDIWAQRRGLRHLAPSFSEFRPPASDNTAQHVKAGDGGRASSSGTGIAIGGPGGSAGVHGDGGAGGEATAIGGGLSVGGEGGSGDGRGGRSGYAWLELPNLPLPDGSHLHDYGRGGDGAGYIPSAATQKPPEQGLVWEQGTLDQPWQFLGLFRQGLEPIIAVNFQMRGYNRSGRFWPEISGCIRSTETGRELPILLAVSGQPVAPEKTYGVPPDARFDVCVQIPGQVGEISGSHVDVFLAEFCPFMFVFRHDGRSYERHFSLEECEASVERFRRASTRSRGPRVTLRDVTP